MSEGVPRLTEFAWRYIRGMRHSGQVKEEHLAEAFRAELGLPEFPRYDHLQRACGAFGIQLTGLPARGLGTMDGVNTWLHGDAPTIALNFQNSEVRRETTLCHEIREVLETAFERVHRSFEPMGDPKKMDVRADRFASYVLMPTEATEKELAVTGFDLLGFSRRRGRSLQSVLLRAGTLYGSEAAERGPVAGVWLFEAPWTKVAAGEATIDDLTLTQHVKLGGFQVEKDLRIYFPRKGIPARKFQVVADAVRRESAVTGEIDLDLFGERSYHVVVEPVVLRRGVWRALFVAVRQPSWPLFNPWMERRDPVWLGRLLPLLEGYCSTSTVGAPAPSDRKTEARQVRRQARRRSGVGDKACCPLAEIPGLLVTPRSEAAGSHTSGGVAARGATWPELRVCGRLREVRSCRRSCGHVCDASVGSE